MFARRLLAVLRVLLLLILIAAGLGFWAWHDFTTPGPLPAKTIVVLPHGEGLSALSERLAQNHIVAHSWSFLVGTFITGQYRLLKAGEYEFEAGMTPAAVADLIASGRVVQHRLTVPEGSTSAEIVALVKSAPALDGTIDAIPPEGALMPDTYFFVLGDKRETLIGRMRRAMDKVLAEAWAKRSPDLGLATPEEAMILASIVEKETAKPEERPHVAGVYLNRLRRGMKLQADPTVLYALSHQGEQPLDRPLTHDDLEVETPYNTYLHPGLPPGPIDNPGRAALMAAVEPEPTDDLYFVSDGKGGHRFSHTLVEQNRNVTSLRKLEALPVPDLPAKK